MINILPSAVGLSLGDLLKEIHEISTPTQHFNIYIDMSGLPRAYIFSVLQAICEKYENNRFVKLFCIYTYPKNYVEGSLQEPAGEMKCVFRGYLPTMSKATLMIFPGFDVEYTTTGLTYVKAKTSEEPGILWFIPFPGRTYRFYERVLETHMPFLENLPNEKIILYPQEELRLAFNILHTKINEIFHENHYILLMPLGCRIICLPIFLNVWLARKEGKKEIDIVFPSTIRYNTLRSSEEYEEPLIDEIPLDIKEWTKDRAG
jgi:hypothetical protein